MDEILNQLRKPKIQGQLRHLLTALGPLLATKGVVNDVEWQMWVGLAMALLGFLSSWNASEKQ
jgi:hypothetical protein